MKKKVIAALSVLMAALIAVTVVSKMDFVKENNGYVDDLPTVDLGGDKAPKPVYHYPADWETDIFTLKEYTGKRLSIEYGTLDNTLLTFSMELFNRSDCLSRGGAALALMYDYFDLLRHGDYEGVNALFRDDYFDEGYLNYEDNELFPEKPFEKFPMQKIYDVTVAKYYYDDKIFEHQENVEPTYYLIEYKIMENDGLFHHGLESDSYGTQIVGILTYSGGTAEIYMIIDTPNVSILR